MKPTRDVQIICFQYPVLMLALISHGFLLVPCVRPIPDYCCFTLKSAAVRKHGRLFTYEGGNFTLKTKILGLEL